MDNYTISDIAAVTGRNDGMFGAGNGGMWIFALLILLAMGNGGGLFGGANAASAQDIQRAVDLNSIQNGQRDIEATVQEVGGELTSTIKDSAYNNLSEIRDVQMGVNQGFANMQSCCCETLRAIDGVNYNGAMNTAAINANTTAAVQKVLDKMSADREATLLQRINQLETQNMFCGIPRINPYGYGVYPYANSCGYGCNSL